MLIYPDIEILRYLSLNFTYAMTDYSQAILYTVIVTVTIILLFTISGLAVFKKKNL